MGSEPALIHLSDVSRVIDLSTSLIPVRSVSLSIDRGEFVAITGRSGAGKSTLLNVIGLLDRPTHGSYVLEGRETIAQRASALARWRASMFGFVFQAYQLLEHRSVIDNVMLGMLYRGWSRRVRWSKSIDALRMVDMSDRALERPAALSGGERQRIAIARAIAGAPDILLCDEPTGNLDADTGDSVMDLFTDLNTNGYTVIVVTHDTDVAARADRHITIEDGSITELTR